MVNKMLGSIRIDKCVAEYTVWLQQYLPYGKMKVKIYMEFYKTETAYYAGYTNIRIKRIFDGFFEGGVGTGKTIEEALDDTIKNFIEIFNADYSLKERPQGLLEEDIEYHDPCEF